MQWGETAKNKVARGLDTSIFIHYDWWRAMRKANPQLDKATVSYRVSVMLKWLVSVEAAQRGIGKGELVERAIRRYLKLGKAA